MTVDAPELQAFRSSLRTLLQRASPEAEVRRTMEGPADFDPQLWKALAGQAGVGGLLVPEELGGSGAGASELAIVMHELGRTLAPAPVLSTVGLAVPLLLACRDDWVDDLLVRVAAGDATIAVSLADASGAWGEAGSVQATGGVDCRVSGTRLHVVNACSADVVLVLAAAPEGPVAVAVEADVDGLSIEPASSMDLTRARGHVHLQQARGRRVGGPGDGMRLVAAARTTATLALASECVGVAERSLERAVAHASNRVQFGRVVGSFQAVKHKCARMLIAQQLAAALVADSLEKPQDPWRASAALALAATTAYRVAADTLQVHGGMGFTWEDASHLYLKRAAGNLHLLGEPRQHKQAVAAALGL